MSHHISLIALSAVLALCPAVPVQAAPRLFGDSVLLRQDGFTDEINGQGPDLVLLAAGPSDGWKTVIRHLRGRYPVHLIVLDRPDGDIAAVDAWLVKRGWTPVLLAGEAPAAALAAAHPENVKQVLQLQGASETLIAALKAFLRG